MTVSVSSAKCLMGMRGGLSISEVFPAGRFARMAGQRACFCAGWGTGQVAILFVALPFLI